MTSPQLATTEDAAPQPVSTPAVVIYSSMKVSNYGLQPGNQWRETIRTESLYRHSESLTSTADAQIHGSATLTLAHPVLLASLMCDFKRALVRFAEMRVCTSHCKLRHERFAHSGLELRHCREWRSSGTSKSYSPVEVRVISNADTVPGPSWCGRSLNAKLIQYNTSNASTCCILEKEKKLYLLDAFI